MWSSQFNEFLKFNFFFLGTALTPCGPDVSEGTLTCTCLSYTHPIQLTSPEPLEGEIGCDLPLRRYAIRKEKFIFQIRIEMYIQACTDIHNFISVGNSSLKGITSPWWLLQCVFSWKRLMLGWQWAYQKQVEATLQEARQRGG